jgi:hypothetical protein
MHTGNCLLCSVKGHLTLVVLSAIRGIKTSSPILEPVRITHCSRHCPSPVTSYRVPLQRPIFLFKFRRSIIITPFFRASLWQGKLFTLMEFRNSVGYSTSKSGMCSDVFDIVSQLRYFILSPRSIETIYSFISSTVRLFGQTIAREAKYVRLW